MYICFNKQLLLSLTVFACNYVEFIVPHGNVFMLTRALKCGKILLNRQSTEDIFETKTWLLVYRAQTVLSA